MIARRWQGFSKQALSFGYYPGLHNCNRVSGDSSHFCSRSDDIAALISNLKRVWGPVIRRPEEHWVGFGAQIEI